MRRFQEFSKTLQLSIFFAKRDLKVRFAGNILGALWLFLYPLCLILMFTFVFSMVLKIRVRWVGGGSFMVFFLSAFFPWLALQEGIMRASSSILENAETVKKVPFPLETIPMGMVLSAFVYHMGAFLVFYLGKQVVDLMGSSFSPIYPIKALFSLPVLAAIQFIMASGIALFLSSICTYVRDLVQVTSLALQLWFYGTPIVYPMDMVPSKLRSVLYLNPYLGLVEGYREIVATGAFKIDPLKVYSFVFSVVVFMIGWKTFQRLKYGFADVL